MRARPPLVKADVELHSRQLLLKPEKREGGLTNWVSGGSSQGLVLKSIPLKFLKGFFTGSIRDP